MKVISNGQRLLVETGESLSRIAKACSVSNYAARSWKVGLATPRQKARLQIQKAYGIHPKEWDKPIPEGETINVPPPNKAGRPMVRTRKQTGKKSAGKPALKAGVVEADPMAPVMDLPPYPEAPLNGTTIENVRHSIVCVQHELRYGDHTTSSRSRLRSDEARSMKLLSQLEREEELREARYVREHPAFKAHCQRILDAVKPYPEVAKAIIDALASDES